MIFAVFGIIASFVLYLLRKIPVKRFINTYSLSDKDFVGSVRALAIALRDPRPFGVGVSRNVFINKTDKVVEIVYKKNKKGADVFEAERWIYENKSIIDRYLNIADLKKTLKLPHVDNCPRILSAARFLVETGMDVLDSDRVCKFLEEFLKHTKLCFKEIKYLKNAIALAVAEKINSLSGKFIHYEKMRTSAQNKYFNSSLSLSDSYLYFYIKYNRSQILDKKIIKEKGTGAESSFYQTLSDNERTVKYLFTVLNNLDEICDLKKLVLTLDGYKRLSQTEEFSLSDFNSKLNYLERISYLYDKLNYSEEELIAKIISVSLKNDLSVADILFLNINDLKKALATGNIKTSERYDRFSLFVEQALIVFWSAVSAFSLAFFKGDISYLFTFFAFYLLLYIPVKGLTDMIVLRCFKTPPVFSYDGKDIYPENGVAVVMPVLIKDENTLKDSFANLNETACQNAYSNANYYLLVDFPSSNIPFTGNDSVLLEKCKEYTLRYPLVKVAIREKTLIKNKYKGYEGKRGAILDFNALLSERTDKFCYISFNEIIAPKYVIVLDGDNILMPGEVLKAVNTFCHPYNRKYDILTFKAEYNPFSKTTYYSERFSSNHYSGEYPFIGNAFYLKYKKDIFTGKGIYDLEKFQTKLKDAFKDETILSHDIIEGAFCLTGTAGVRCFEDCPNTFISDLKRKERWTRGDLLLFPYVFSAGKNKFGVKNTNKISPVYKELIFQNVIRCVCPIILFAGFIISGINKDLTLFLSVLNAALFLPQAQILATLKNFSNVRTKRFVINIISIIFNAIYDLLLLPLKALFNKNQCSTGAQPR